MEETSIRNALLKAGWFTVLIGGLIFVGRTAMADPAAESPILWAAASDAATPQPTQTPASMSPQPAKVDWLDWNGANFFGPCHDDCSGTVFGGRQITTAMQSIMLIHNPVPIWNWQWGGAGIVGGEFSRRLVTFWKVLSIEPQLGVAQRFGDMHAAEFWGVLVFRWIAFPWNNYIKTSVAVADGISLATQIDNEERDKNRNHAGSIFLNYFTPEITFALPKYQTYELVFAVHHRSGLYGLIDHVNAGSQFGTVGLRIHF